MEYNMANNKLFNDALWDKIKIGLQVAQFFIMIVLSIGAFFVKHELSQIQKDRQAISELREFMAETKGNRFTASDGLKVYQEISKIREEMAKYPTEVPPPWFKDMVEEIKKQGDATKVTVDSIKMEVLKNGNEISHLKTELADLRRVNGS